MIQLVQVTSCKALPVSQVTNRNGAKKKADVECGLEHVHHPSVPTHQIKLETRNINILQYICSFSVLSRFIYHTIF